MRSDEPFDHLKEQSREKPLSRRDFMRVLTVAGAAGPGLAATALTGFSFTRSQRAEATEVIVAGLGEMPKRRLGTKMGNMMVTPMCICSDWNRDLFGPGVAAGLNFIHKAGYWGDVPAEVKKLPRESYYTDITVDTTSPGHNPDNFDEAYNQVVQSLDHNGLKYYDIYRAHYGWHSVKNFADNNVSYKVFQKLKKEGKVRYFGVSQHPYKDGTDHEFPVAEAYPEIIQAEIDSGIVDSMQVWFSFGYPKEVEAVFAKASAAGVGMTAMKINAHGRGRMQGDAARMAALGAPGQPGRAVIRDVMTRKRPDGKPIFHTCVSALGNMQVFEENLGAVSPKVSMRDGFDGYEILTA